MLTEKNHNKQIVRQRIPDIFVVRKKFKLSALKGWKMELKRL